MGFWTFCCKTPQFYQGLQEWSKFFRQFPVDAEGDWKVLASQAGVLSDGSLWCWNDEVALFHIHRYGLDYHDPFTSINGTNERMAVRIGTDNDWKFVTWGDDSGRGYAIKEDGSLWAFGKNNTYDGFETTYGSSASALGIGLVNKNVRIESSGWEVRLSSSIATATAAPRGQFLSSHRPARLFLIDDQSKELPDAEFSQATTKAQMDFDWIAAVRSQDFTLTSGGSGYKSAPTVTLVGSGADAGKTITGSVMAMSPPTSTVTGFSVVNAGRGYTYATAHDKHSNASAHATIADGKITGWVIASQPVKTYTVLTPEKEEVSICGDGSGAEAAVVRSTSSVQRIAFPDQYSSTAFAWTERPTIQFSGGGGSGAAANVLRIAGYVTNIRLTNPGAGYHRPLGIAAQPSAEETNLLGGTWWGVGSTTLTPSRIHSIVKTNADQLFPSLSIQSTGTVPPQQPRHFNSSSGVYTSTVTRVEIVASGKPSVVLAGGSLGTTLTGYAYSPLLRVSRNWRRYGGSPAAVTDRRELEVTQGFHFSIVQRLNDASWPCSENSRTVTATVSVQGAATVSNPNISGTFTNIDGMLLLDSHNTATVTVADGAILTPKISVTPVANNDPPIPHTNTTHVEHFDVTWIPPTTAEKVRLYFSPPTHGGGGPAYAEVSPDPSGKPGAITIIEQGGFYTEPPSFIATTHFFPDPVRVGSDTWISASSSGLRSFGITTDGDLYWWGFDTANKGKECPFPAPVGRGVAFDISGGERVGDKASVSEAGGGGASRRFYCDVPQHGNRIAVPSMNWSTSSPAIQQTFYDVPPDQFQYTRGYYFSAVVGRRNASIKSSQRFLYAHDEYFVDSPRERYWNEALMGYTFLGKGYSSAPQAYFIQQGPTAEFSISSRLVGPSKFTHLVADYARDEDGRWYYIPSQDRGYVIPGPIPEHSYSVTHEADAVQPKFQFFAGPLPFGHWRKVIAIGQTTVTRTETHSIKSYVMRVTDSGSGYASPTITVTSQSSAQRVLSSESPPPAFDITFNGVDLDTVDDPLGGKSGTLSLSPVTSTRSVSYQGRFIVEDSGGCGEVRESGYPETIVSYSQPTLVLSDQTGGQGATVDVVTFEEGFESHLAPVTAAGMSENFSGAYGITQSGDVISTAVTPDKPGSWSLASTTSQGLDSIGFDQIVGKAMRVGGKAYLLASLSYWQQWWPFELAITNIGKGYEEHAKATVSQQPGVARFDAVFDGKVVCMGVVSQGQGYSSPPQVTLTAGPGGGVAGTATATIAGPVSAVTVTNAGSGYRIPPRVVFSGNGIAPDATCTLNSSGGVESVTISNGGRYRNTPPTVSFAAVNDVETLTLTAGGSGYKAAPKVHIGSGGGEGATATARICAVVSEIIVEDGGSGYTEPPVVTINGGGGSGATATAILNADGAVESIAVDSGGECYRSTPTVAIRPAAGKPGGGATATAVIDGYVDQVTLLTRGRDFVNAPTVTFYDGGGSGASATAVLGAAGSGATGTVVFDGSVIFCTASGSSNLQQEPTVAISDSTNHRIAALQTLLDDGEITQAQFNERSKQFRAVARAAIKGKITSINVVNGGTHYRSTGPRAVSICNKTRLARPRVVSSECIKSTNANTLGLYFSDPLPFTVNSSGAVTSVDATPVRDAEYLKKPDILPEDAISLRTQTCLRAVGCGVHSADTVTSRASAAKTNSKGVASASSTDKRYGSRTTVNDGLDVFEPSTIALRGSVLGLRNGYYALAFNTLGPSISLYFLTPPTVQIQDEVGSGATVTIGPGPSWSPGTIVFSASSGGSGYTLAAKPVIIGGVPLAWSSSPTATAVVSGGRVSSVTVGSNNVGYLAPPDVLLVGGGGLGATAVAALDSSGRVASIAVTCQGKGYTSAPTVVVVDKEKLYERGLLADYIKRFDPVLIKDYTVEYCLHDAGWQVTTNSPVNFFRSAHGASFIPFFDDSGHVEHIDTMPVSQASENSAYGSRDITATPTVTFSGRSQEAAEAEFVPIEFTDVMSGAAAKTTEAYWLP